MTSGRWYRITVPLGMAMAAIGLWLMGNGWVSHAVHDQPSEDSDGEVFMLFERISDPWLMVETTYGGVERDPKGKLYFTYDRNADTGTKPCPT